MLGHGAGWSALLGSVYAVGGAVLCGLGAVGEYVGRIYEQVKGRPLYVVKETEADVEPGHTFVLEGIVWIVGDVDAENVWCVPWLFDRTRPIDVRQLEER